MSTLYQIYGSNILITSKENLSISDKLPAATYTIKKDPKDELYLTQIENFVLPSKMYGETVKQTDRMYNTFMSRDSSTGVLLTGDKGSGKTLLAKSISSHGLKEGVSTVVVNQPLYGEKFNAFIQSISEPAIIIFDEFEKVYDADEQKHLLTLLDGVYGSKKMFILTSNDYSHINTYMLNRPGRIFYYVKFEGLSEEFIREYCEDNLINKKNLENLISITNLFSEFNFDMLKGLIEEMNRYNESPKESLKMLNIVPKDDTAERYELKLLNKNNDDITKELASLTDDTGMLNFFIAVIKTGSDQDRYEIQARPFKESREFLFEEGKEDAINFAPSDIKSVKNRGNYIFFENQDGFKMILNKSKSSSFDRMSLLI